MKKNEIKLFLDGKPVFENRFCTNKYLIGKKCKKFYISELAKKVEHISVCPYGYSCVFGTKYVVSGIIDEKYCNLKLIESRLNFNKRIYGKNVKIEMLSLEDLEEIKNEVSENSILEEYKSTFHDLNNNHRYLLDNYNVLNDELKKIYISNVQSLSNIYLKHKEKIKNAILSSDKFNIYSSEIDEIDYINKQLLEIVDNDNKSVLDFKSSLEFNDFRIRYLHRIITSSQATDDSRYLKDISIHKILTKLKYVFLIPSKKKNQTINMNLSYDTEVIKVYDDIYVGFFILFENAIKYAPFSSIIDVYYYNNENKIEISFENYSDYVGDISRLLERGMQGDNHKDGNGLGLTIAYDIFEKSGFNLSVYYADGKFICKLTKDVY